MRLVSFQRMYVVFNNNLVIHILRNFHGNVMYRNVLWHNLLEKNMSICDQILNKHDKTE